MLCTSVKALEEEILLLAYGKYTALAVPEYSTLPSSISAKKNEMLFNHHALGSHYLILIVPDRNWDTGKKEIYSPSLNYNTSGKKKTLYFIKPTV